MCTVLLPSGVNPTVNNKYIEYIKKKKKNTEILLFVVNNVDLKVTDGETSAFLISSFRRVLNVVMFPLDDLPAFEVYVPTFRNTLSVPSS